MGNKPSFPPRTYAEARAYYAQADIHNAIQTADMEAVQRGRAEGRAEGLAEGRAEEKLATAKKMKAKGYPIEDIAEMTGLTTEEIGKL